MYGHRITGARSQTPLQVGLDVTPVILGHTGVARYARELGVALEAAGVTVHRFSIARASGGRVGPVRHLRIPRRLIECSWNLTGMPRAEWIVPGIELVHATDLAPVPSRYPSVVTVHDLAALEHPDLHPAVAVDQQRRQLRALRRAALVLSVSRSTARALERSGVPPHRIAVTPLGLRRASDVADPPVPRSPFVLAVGELHARKGLDVLIRAVARSGTGLPIVFAGPGDPARLRAVAATSGIGADVRFLGIVEEPVLAGLYRDALVLCAPSSAEGFGLPVLEALGSGLPVIASDLEVFRELTDGAAVLVPVGDELALSAAILRISSSRQDRERLSAAGRSQSASFTWERTAALTIDAYRRVLACA